MLVTEEQARKLWCPFAMVGMSRAMPAKGGGEECTRCIASECMAWRWTVDDPMKRQGSADTRGYCGLAGKLT